MPSIPETYRRLLPFALTVACVPLLFAWGTTLDTNCLLGTQNEYCYIAGIHPTYFFTGVALPAGLAGGGVGWILPSRWIDPLAARSIFRLVVNARTRTLLALGVLVPAASAFAPFLFFGGVTSRFGAWLLLAVPYYPGVAFIAILAKIDETAILSALPDPLLVALIAVSFVVAAAGQAVWFYLVSGVLGRLGSAIHRPLADGVS